MQIKDTRVQLPHHFFPAGTTTVHKSVCQPLDETEGAQPRIRLTGNIYRAEWASRTQGWNVSERKCIIDQSLLKDVVLFLPSTEQDEGLKENNSLYQRLSVCCAIVSLPAPLPTHSPLHLHR